MRGCTNVWYVERNYGAGVFQHYFLRWVTGTPPVTHIYIKSSSNQRSTTSRVASAAGRLVQTHLPECAAHEQDSQDPSGQSAIFSPE